MITNDHMLTEQRKKANKDGVLHGFPIWVLRNRYNSILGVFASKDNALKKQEELQRFMNIRLDLIFVEDIKHISFDLERL